MEEYKTNPHLLWRFSSKISMMFVLVQFIFIDTFDFWNIIKAFVLYLLITRFVIYLLMKE